MDKRDYYAVLEVNKTATDQELKSAYRRLAMRYHPDKNPGDTAAEEKFKEAAEAYAVLSDGEQRRRYDRFGHAAFQNGGPSGAAQDFGSFSDIFENIFGEFMNGGPDRRRAGVLTTGCPAHPM